MGLETGSFVADLVLSNPVAGDGAGQGDDHIRLIKTCVQSTFPGMGGAAWRVTSVNAGFSVSAASNMSVFLGTNSLSTTVTMSLPAVATAGNGYMLGVAALPGATMLIDPSGAELIEGASTFQLGDQNAALLFCDGSQWLAMAFPLLVNGQLTIHGGMITSATAVFLNSLRAESAFFVGSTSTLSGTVALKSLLDVQSGQVKFPAAQNASADANTLDDYEEGTWTPTITFQTAGDLNVVYSFNTGTYTKIGRLVTVHASIATTTFTHTTASGQIRIDGLPYAVSAAHDFAATLSKAEGIVWTAASEQLVAQVLAGTTSIRFYEMLPSGATTTDVEAVQLVSGVNKNIRLTLTFHV